MRPVSSETENEHLVMVKKRRRALPLANACR
jgi:hypothetical protein